MAADLHLDLLNSRIILESSKISWTVREIGSRTKEDFQLASNIEEDKAFTWSGLDDLPGTNVTGVVMKLTNGWTVQAETQGSNTTVTVNQGIIIPETEGGIVFQPQTNISYATSDTTVSALITAIGGGADRSLDK